MSRRSVLRNAELEALCWHETEVGQVDPVPVCKHVVEVRSKMRHALRAHMGSA